MKDQIQEKLAQGFDTIKMKVGAIDFEREFHLLESIRKEFSKRGNCFACGCKWRI